MSSHRVISLTIIEITYFTFTPYYYHSKHAEEHLCHSEPAEKLIVILSLPKNILVILSLPKNKERALLFISTAAEKSIFGNCGEYTKTCLHTE